MGKVFLMKVCAAVGSCSAGIIISSAKLTVACMTKAANATRKKLFVFIIVMFK